MLSYQSVLPYSEIRYVMTTGDKEQHLNVRFGRQFTPSPICLLRLQHRLFARRVQEQPKPSTTISGSMPLFHQRQTLWRLGLLLSQQTRNGRKRWHRQRRRLHFAHRNRQFRHQRQPHNATNFIVSSGIGLEHYFNLLPQKTVVKIKKPPAENDSITNFSCQRQSFDWILC